MRDKQRIDPFCEILSTAWKRVPDMRFGQLMYNFFHDEYNSDPFYIEDTELISRFQAYVDKISKNMYSS